jgi:hypothetical protein
MPAKYVDHLTEDSPIPGQNWVCISFIAPEIEKIKNCSLRGIKIRGVFSKKEDANSHAEKLRQTDPDFDIFVGEVGKWLPWDPNPENVEDERYQEKELNHIVSNYKKSREQSAVMYEERKKEMMQKNTKDEDVKLKKMRERLQSKLADKKHEKSKNDDVSNMMQRILETERELKEMEEQESKVHSQVDLDAELDDMINDITKN